MSWLDNSKYPFNQLPVLEVDGTPICQSMTIMRYLGKEHGMIFVSTSISISTSTSTSIYISNIYG